MKHLLHARAGRGALFAIAMMAVGGAFGAAQMGGDLIVNGGFETGSLSPWTGSRVNAKNGPYNPGNFCSGNYCAVVQCNENLTQVVDARGVTKCTLTWKYQRRTSYGNYPYYTVYFDGEIVKAEEYVNDNNIHYGSIDLTLSEQDTHTLKFQGRANGDSTVFIDDVALTVTGMDPSYLFITNTIADIEYRGSNNTDRAVYSPKPIVTDPDGTVLVEDEDYVLVYSNNTQKGVATVVAVGVGSHAGHSDSTTYNIIEPIVPLPNAYQKLKSITSTGTQCIDTGVTPSSWSTTVELEFNTGTYEAGTTFFGTQWSDRRYLFDQQNNAYYWHGWGNWIGTAYNNIDAHFWIRSDSVVRLWISGKQDYSRGESREAWGSGNIYIFACNNKTRFSKYSLYSMKMTNGSTALRDFVPARRLSDGSIGLYDTVGSKFYENCGTGTFVAGADVGARTFATEDLPVQILEYGKQAKPMPVVYAPTDYECTTPLVYKVDYDLAWDDNEDIGTGYVTITGLGDYAGLVRVVAYSISHSMYDVYETVEYIQSDGSQRINTGQYDSSAHRLRGNHTFHLKWRQGWLGMFYNSDLGWGCTADNSTDSWNYSVRSGGRRRTWSNENDNFDNNSIYPRIYNADRGMRPSDWNTTVIPNTNVIFEETCKVDTKIVVSIKNTTSGITYATDPSIGATSGTNFCSRAPIYLFGDCYDVHRGKKAIYGCKMVNDLTGETEWELVPCYRLKDGKPGMYDMKRNEFYTDIDGGNPFVCGPVTGQFALPTNVYVTVDNQPVDPIALADGTCVHRQTGAELYADTDFTYAISNNAAPGKARIYFTGLGNYAGRDGFYDFTIVDGGTSHQERFAKLSRAYVRSGLCALYDAIDNAGTGTHDPTTIVWKDLGPYHLDATVGVCSVWADGSCLRSTNGTYEAGVCPVTTPLALAKSYVPPSDTYYTIEMRFKGNQRFQSHEPLLYDRYQDGSNQQFLQWRNYYTRWYCAGSGRTTYDWTSGPWLTPGEVFTFSTQIATRGFRIYYDPDNCVGNDSVNWTYLGPSGYPITFGGRRNASQYTFVGDFHSIRVYRKPLTQNEMRYNRAIDKVRFEGASLGNVLPAMLPAGYSYDRTNDAIRVNVCANALTAEGHLRVNGGEDLAKITNMVVELGTVITLEYVPKDGEQLTKWFDLPGSDWEYPDPADTNVVRFTAWGPVSVAAVSPLTSSSSTLPARTYVPNGLIGLWDGIDNVNEGHNRTGYSDWKDLSGKANSWWKYYGSDVSNGRTMSQGRSTFYYTDQFPAYKSIELVYKHTGNESSYGGMIFVRKNDYNRTVMSHLGLKGVSGSACNSYWPTPYCVSDFITSDRANTVCVVPRNAATGGKIFSDETFYVNGGLRGTERGNYSDVNVTGYSYSYISGEDVANSNHRTCSGTFHAMRIYDRELTPAEASFNAAVDRVRYFGANPEDVFPYVELPDGYRWNATDRCLEVRFTAGTQTGGTLEPAPGTVSWHAVGSSVTVKFTPDVDEQEFRFEGLPTNASTSDEGRTATFKIACPTTVSGVMEQVFPARSYVSDGLYNLWDGIDNVNKGVANHSTSSMKWYDLCGHSTYPWELVTGRGRFTQNALQCCENYEYNHAAVMPNLIRPFTTLEVSATPFWSDNAYHQVLWTRDMRQMLQINSSPSTHVFTTHYMNMSNESPGYSATNVAAHVANTYAAVYTNHTDVVGYALNGEYHEANYTISASIRGWLGYYCGYGGDGSAVDSSYRRYATIGSRYQYNNSNVGSKFYGDVHCIRLYDRPLEAHELAFNAAMDRVRFHGARAQDEFPNLFRLPDGYRWNNDKKILEVLVSCSISNGLGKVSLNGATAGKSASGYFPCGETVSFTAVPNDGRIVRDWQGITGFTYEDGSDFATISFVAASPVKAVVETVPEEGLVPYETYVTDGLVNAWDALKSPGDDRAWIDMKEKVQMSLVSGSLQWMGHALRFNGQTYMSGYQPTLRQAIKDKSVTVQLFIRPQTFTFNGGYFSQGDSKRYRSLMLAMQGQQWVSPYWYNEPGKKSIYGAFGMLYYCCDTGNEEWWRVYHPDGSNFIDSDTSMYFGRDTLVTITRDSDGVARLYLNDGQLLLSNGYKSTSDSTYEYTCFGAFYGGSCAHFDMYAFRVYDRVLSTGEMTVNNIVDRLRFLGDTSAVPSDMKYEDGRLYSRFVAYADDPTLGGVAFTNGTPAASCEAWAEVGKTLTVTFTPNAGYAPLSWSNQPPASVASGSGGTISFTVSTPVTNMVARAKEVSGFSDENFTATHYIPNLAATKKAVGNRTMYWFTNLTSDTVYMTAAQDLTIESALVVGGGGAGGAYIGGGGGGGGCVELKQPVFVPKGGAIVYKVGAGGKFPNWSWARGDNGEATLFGVDGFAAKAFGGGGGGGHNSQGVPWSTTLGSGGGAARGNGTSVSPGRTFTLGQGWYGGGASNDRSGGGGGGDGPGRASTSSISGDGGPGRLTFITGEADQVGSGGGGGTRWDANCGGKGGKHAGNGASSGWSSGKAAEQGYGGGGGGGSGDGWGANGGSGCVFISIRAGNTTTKPLTVTLASSNVVWTGSALTPSVTVKDWNGTKLTAGTHYTLTWLNNTDPGRGYVRVDGKSGTSYAGLTAEATFMIYRIFYAATDGNDSNDGLSWAAPKTLAGAITAASAYASEYTRPEVWCKAGTLSNWKSTITIPRRMAVRGGYKGDGDKLADDPITWIIGDASSCNEMLKDNSSLEFGGGLPAVFQRFGARQGKYRCVYRGGNTGDFELRDCRFSERNGQQQFEGRGLCLYGNSALSTLVISNCVIEGCVDTSWHDRPVRGGGAYIANWKRTTMDNCLFITNGITWETALHGYYDYACGSHIYFANTPVTARNCEFRASMLQPSHRGGSIVMIGNCNGSAFTNCAFVGNCEYPYNSDWSTELAWAGSLYVEMDTGAQAVDLMNCTFAYNIVGSQYAAAGVSIYCGTVRAKNCIFWNNTTSTWYDRGTDVHIRSGRGHFECDWSLFGGRGTSYFNASDGGTISLGDNCIVGEDPLFVTPPEDVTPLLNGGTFRYPKTDYDYRYLTWKRNIATRDKIASIDVHLRTPLVKEGETAYDELSPAIDAGDPADDWSLEPGKNGKRRNLGAYGNTSEAAQTPDPGDVSCTLSVSYLNGNSEPVANINLFTSPATVFGAEVTVYYGTDSTFATYDRVQKLTVQSGKTVQLPAGIGYLAGTKVYVKVVATVNGETKGTWTNVETAQPATGEMPKWCLDDGSSHGGDSNRVIHVRSDQLNPNARGTSWQDAISDFYAAVSMLDDTRNEIWFCGEQKLASDPGVINFTRKAYIRGGFDGSEDDPSEREAGRRATIDGQKKAYCLIFTNTKELTLDGIAFTRGTSIGVRKKSSVGDLTVSNCAFTCSGSTARWGADTGGGYDWSWEGGGGANFIGSSTSTLRVYDSDFSGNTTISYAHSGSGGGAAIATWKMVYMDHCNFDTNQPNSYARGHAVALHFYNAPFEMTRTRFRGNYIRTSENNSGTCGSILAVVGSCGGSVLRSCVFSGNNTYDWMTRGILYFYLDTVETAATVENCTFGYNLCGPVAALSVGRGTVTAKNCIFYGNSTYSGGHADAYCYEGGNLGVSYSMFGGQGAAYWAAANNDQLTVDRDTCYFTDPLFVSDTNAFMIATSNAGFPTYSSGKDFTSRKAGLLLDVHLRSHGGTTLDDGTVRSYQDLCSPGVDAGDKSSDILDEPYPNGDRRNLGGYGGTPEAAYTPTGTPGIADAVRWMRESEYSQPTVYFTLGGTGFYTASALLSVSLNGGATWEELKEFTGLAKGDTLTYEVPKSYEPGATLCFKVDLTANGETVTVTSTPKRVWGELPFGYEKGGDREKIIHLRPDATGKGTGDNWWDAVTTLEEAWALLTYDRHEIWIGGSQKVNSTSGWPSLGFPLVVRGGFVGDETDPSQRPDDGSVSWLDGCQKANTISYSSSQDVTLDRIGVTLGQYHGIYKSGGNGSMTLVGCQILNNSLTYSRQDSGQAGRGIWFSGNSAGTLTLTNCYIAGNGPFKRESGYNNYSAGYGQGVYIEKAKGLIMDDTSFVTNGVPLGSHGPVVGGDCCVGSALYATGVPVTARRCRFISNHGTVRDNGNNCGGAVRLNGACGGSSFVNCIFAGNSDRCGWDGTAGTYGGAFVATLSAATDAVDFDHCTFAYNLTDGTQSPGAINLVKGTANVRNSIFYGNLVSSRSSVKARDIRVQGSGICNVDYTLLCDTNATSYSAASGGVINLGEGVIYGDPDFISPAATVTNAYVTTESSYRYFKTTTAVWLALAELNVHVKSMTGYEDEVTHEQFRTLGTQGPTVDAGDPASPYALEPHPNGDRANLGAYGNTPYATRSRGGGRVIFRSR